MELKLVDPRSLQENPDKLRRAKSNPPSDVLLLAPITAVGIVQPPVVYPAPDGGNGFVINFGHRRVAQAIAAGHELIQVIVTTKDDSDHGMSAFAENIVREPLNPVDPWRAIERLAALGWTEESISMALASQVRQVKKLRLLANVLPAILDQMAKGDMPNESQLAPLQRRRRANRRMSGSAASRRRRLRKWRGIRSPTLFQNSAWKPNTRASAMS